MQSEFEEKTYEQYLTSALAMGPNAFFAPGQVLEHIIGFDVALLSSNSDFFTQFPYLDPCWRILPFPLHPGVVLVKDWWDELQNTLETFPRFKFNCFIQAKRPERMVRSDATEFIHWNKPYFRYDTFIAQQTALARLATLTSGRAIVTYACPAFWKKAHLWRAVESGQIVGQSNFCEVERLTGHSRYSFLSPGNAGIGHSEPKHIESVPFEMALQTLVLTTRS